LTTRDITASADELLTYHREFQALFQRREQRHWSLLYLCGQLSNLKRKTMEAMVLALIGSDPNAIRGLQQFIGQGRWDTAPFIELLQERVATWLGEPEGVVIVDGSGFVKDGEHSVGVAWQYCNHLGKLANCQQGVFLVYASRRGYAFVAECLYLPEAWFGEAYRERWQECGIPENTVFRTEPQLGLEMIGDLVAHAVVPFRWVAADESYGKSPVFLEGLEALGKWYLAEVPSDTRVWLRTPAVEPPGVGLSGQLRKHSRVKVTASQPQELRELVTRLPRPNWQRRIIQEGSQGPIVAEFAAVRVTPVRDELPGPRSWAISRRDLGSEPEVKYYLSNAPTSCPLPEFVRVSGMRWPVETAIKEGRGELGMDHHETRTWQGWHHHMLHSMWGHLFLIRLCLVFQKKSGADHCPSAPVAGAGYRRRLGALARPAGDPAVSPAPELRCLLFPPQAHLFAVKQTAVNPTFRQSIVDLHEVS
jgi:SRSO17 transposase